MLSCIVIAATVVVTEKPIEPSGPFRAGCNSQLH